ncbi:unnamed protein product, partial [Rotaria magnacalcarata]
QVFAGNSQNTAPRIIVLGLDENELIPFTQNDKQRQYKIFIIGNNSGTSPLLVYDELIDNLQISESYIFTQIKCKKIHNKIILTTTANSIIDKATNIVIPDLNDMNKSMSLKQIDIEQIACCFDEISHSQKEPICSTCKQNMMPVIDNQKTTFYTKTDILQKYFQQHNPQLPITNENLSEYYLINGPWLLTLSHFRHELININK